MCNNEALVNQLLCLVEQYGVDEDGRLDREKAYSVMLPAVCAVNPSGEDD